MASSFSLSVIVAVAFFSVLAYSQELGVTDEEEVICQEAAQDSKKQLAEAKKDRRYSCNIICRMDDGTEETKSSPDGQRCCDMGGGAPTGTCKDGKCPVSPSVIG